MVKDFYLTKRLDSSSLKKPKNTAIKYFSDVYEVDQNIVKVNKLNSFSEIIIATRTPRLLKIDVQGNEFELLEGSNNVLVLFKFIIVECTYFDLYEDSKYFSDDIHQFLMENNFELKKEYNKLIRRNKLISSDKLYVNLGI